MENTNNAAALAIKIVDTINKVYIFNEDFGPEYDGMTETERFKSISNYFRDYDSLCDLISGIIDTAYNIAAFNE